MKDLSIWIIIVGILIGLWAWQVNNIGVSEAQQNVHATYYNPVSVEDRAIGMAFAYLICAVGGFTFVMATDRHKPEVLHKPDEVTR